MWRVFILWISREVRLWKLNRDMNIKRQVWLDTRLLVKHPNEYVRHKKSSLAFLDYWKAADAHEAHKARRKTEGDKFPG